MRRVLYLLAIGVCANALMTASASAQAAPEVSLTRLDCGTSAAPTDVGQRFTDIYGYQGVKIQLVFSCYLIKHGDDYMVWDTGQPTTAGAVAPKTPLSTLLAQTRVEARADQVCRHQPLSRRSRRPGGLAAEGDVADRQGRLGRSDRPEGRWCRIPRSLQIGSAAAARSSRWLVDKDVFGDGTVVMLNTPGHTPGHHSPPGQAQGDGPGASRPAISRTSARTMTTTACPTSTPIAPTRSPRSSVSSRSRRTSKRPSSSSTTRAT